MAALGFAIALVATLPPTPGTGVSDTPWCLLCGEFGAQDFITNVLLFLPFGGGLRLAGASWRRALVLVAATTLSIEALQVTVIAGRDASLGDVVANVTGGALGAQIAATSRSWLRPTPARAPTLAWAASLACLVLLAGTAAALRPARPSGPYWGQWAPRRAGSDEFRGITAWAHIDGAPLPIGPIRPGTAADRALRRDIVLLEAGVIPGPAPTGSGAIVGIASGSRKVLTIAQHGRDLTVTVLTWANRWRLRSPVLRVEGVFPPHATAGDQGRASGAQMIRISGGIVRNRLVLAGRPDASRPGQRLRGAELALTPTHGWGLLLPSAAVTEDEARVLSALWVAALLVPLGYWSAGALRREAEASAGARRRWRSGDAACGARALGTLAVGLGAIPAAFHVAAVPWSDWCAATIGLGAGWWLGQRSFRPAATGPGADAGTPAPRR